MRFLRGVATALIVTALPMTAAAQTDAGRISGTVRDQSSAFVAGATVTVKNDKTGEVRSIETNDDGFFVIAPLKPSTYTISAEKAGFAVIEYPQMPVAVGQELALDFEFKPAGVQEIGHRGRRARRCSTSARRGSAPTSASAKCRACRSTAGRCRS